jgi:hypothetical protein
MRSICFLPSAFCLLLIAGISRAERLAGWNVATLPESPPRLIGHGAMSFASTHSPNMLSALLSLALLSGFDAFCQRVGVYYR